MKKTFLLIASTLFLFYSCGLPDTDEQVEGMKPIYTSISNAHTIEIQDAQKMLYPGKIYTYNNYLFVNERGKGIHVINNINPSSPKKISFINIPGNYDIAIKGTTMYVDNFMDVVAIDISNIINNDSITVVKRLKDVMQATSSMAPENYTGFFECVDTTKGYVIGWEMANLTNPKCYK